MGVYSKSGVATGVALENVEAIPCNLDNMLEASYLMVNEAEENYNRIMQAIGIEELAAFEESGVEMVYEAGNVQAMATAVKNFFLNILKKIKGLFEKFFAMFDSFIKSDKDFVSKYGKKVVLANFKELKFKGFEFSNLELDLDKTKNGVNDKFSSKVSDDLDTDAKNDIVEAMRGAAIGKSESYSSSEYSKVLFEFFRSNEGEKKELENLSGTKLLADISGSSELKKAAEKCYKNLTKLINDSIRDTEKASKDAVKGIKYKGDDKSTDAEVEGVSADVKKYANLVYFYKEGAAIAQIVNGAQLSAIKAANRQAKAACVAAMYRKEPKNESYSFTDESVNEGWLSGVVIK